jgi:hypothetical protein
LESEPYAVAGTAGNEYLEHKQLNETLVTVLQALIIIGGMLLLAELCFVLIHRRIAVHITMTSPDSSMPLWALRTTLLRLLPSHRFPAMILHSRLLHGPR